MKKLIVILLLSNVSIVYAVEILGQSFYTTIGYGPDKWASVWLIETSGANSRLYAELPSSTESASAILFDNTNAELNRTGTTTTYSALESAFNLADPVSKQVGKIIQEIEIDAWKQDVSIESKIVEYAFRGMQVSLGRDKVTKACYLAFFDKVASAIEGNSLLEKSSDELQPDSDCVHIGPFNTDNEIAASRVPVLELSSALKSLAQNSNVVFVDTRETWEFEEGHIPGAINIKLRDVKGSLKQVLDADLVIAYCVKDFRGYEAARAFRKLGVNAAVMKPHGMRGWIEQGLPVAGSKGMTEAEALQSLQSLAF